MERKAAAIGRRLRAYPDPKDEAAGRLLAAAEDAAALLSATIRAVRAEVAAKERLKRGQ